MSRSGVAAFCVAVLVAAIAVAIPAGRPAAAAVRVTVDVTAARAVLAALGDPALTRERAVVVARLPGNVGLTRKLASFGPAADEGMFADALVAAAHGEAGDPRFGFARIRAAAREISATLDAAETPAFAQWVTDRLTRFSPVGIDARVRGYLIAGGTSTGFAFGDPTFYLDASRFPSDPLTARVVMAHEMYHAVQNVAGALVHDRRVLSFDETAYGRAGAGRACYAVEGFLGAFRSEGTASFVGDVMSLRGDEGAGARFQHDRFVAGLRNVRDDLTLLDLEILGLASDPPVAFDAAYALGFYDRELLYYPAYVVARAVATDRGPQALADSIAAPGSALLRIYATLPKYGKDDEHPRLGPATERWIAKLATCASRPA